MASSWRSAADWRSINLPLTTGSDRACKLYDAALTQFVSWKDDPTMGGLGKTIQDCVAEDPNFVMGHVLLNALQGRTTEDDSEFERDMNNLVKLAETQQVTEREKQHVQAVNLSADGFTNEAVNVWEDILVQHPTDIMALKLCYMNYIYLGKSALLRDSVAAVLPLWKSSMPLYSYLYGMHAFGLEETSLYKQAECAAKKGLELNEQDGWATHALAHVYEMEGRTEEGISFLSNSLENWQKCNHLTGHNTWHWSLYHIEQKCNHLTGHNTWHWSLYHIEQGEHDAALDILSTQLMPRCKPGCSLLDILDSTSLLWRLKMEGLDVRHFWPDLLEACRPHLEEHTSLFHDVHLFMACLGAGDQQAVNKFTDTLNNFISNGKGTNWKVTKDIGPSLCTALQALSEERYSDVISALYPVRYDIINMGGSHAQRDVFNIALISAAVKSTNPKDQALARKLLLTRQALKGRCTLAERMQCHLQPLLQN